MYLPYLHQKRIFKALITHPPISAVGKFAKIVQTAVHLQQRYRAVAITTQKVASNNIITLLVTLHTTTYETWIIKDQPLPTSTGV